MTRDEEIKVACGRREMVSSWKRCLELDHPHLLLTSTAHNFRVATTAHVMCCRCMGTPLSDNQGRPLNKVLVEWGPSTDVLILLVIGVEN